MSVTLSEGKDGQPGRSLYVELGVWYNKETGDIHMTAQGVPGFHTTVNDKEGSLRCHGNLYDKFKKLLQEHDRWPTD